MLQVTCTTWKQDSWDLHNERVKLTQEARLSKPWKWLTQYLKVLVTQQFYSTKFNSFFILGWSSVLWLKAKVFSFLNRPKNCKEACAFSELQRGSKFLLAWLKCICLQMLQDFTAFEKDLKYWKLKWTWTELSKGKN